MFYIYNIIIYLFTHKNMFTELVHLFVRHHACLET